MLVNLKAIIRDLSPKTNIITVLKESIVNSIQAHATKIDILFQLYGNKDLLQDQPVFAVSVFDNGDGFTTENIKSFSTYKSDYKIEKGCKGVGRITYLKVFEKVEITSFNKSENNVRVSLNFTPDFTQDSFKKENGKQDKWWTTQLFFENPYTQTDLNISIVRDEIYYHLLPLLFLNKEKDIKINFYVHEAEDLEDLYKLRNAENLESLKKSTISTQDLPYLEVKTFNIGLRNIPFTLSYYFENNENYSDEIKAFYCAHNRTVMPFSEFIKIQPIKNVIMIFLLESHVLNKHVNDERNCFDIDEKQADLETQLTWGDINKKLEHILDEIINHHFPQIKEEKIALLEKVSEEYPYLVEFLDTKDVIGGIFTEDSLIEKAEKKYSTKKLAFKRILREGKGRPKNNFKKAQKFASLELTQYIQFRNDILCQFSNLLQPQTLEKDIHNLFVPQQHTADKNLPLALEKNNLWILDDALMGYSYLQSEKNIKNFLSKVNKASLDVEENNKGLSSRPDVALYFDSEEKKRAVLIEFKSPVAYYKNTGVAQLMYYAKTLKEYGVGEMYLYLIAEIDDAFSQILCFTNHFTKVFSPEGEYYRNYWPYFNACIQVVSPKTLLENAKLRNSTFMDIIKKDSLRHKKI
ncbi:MULTISPECIES: ATP-binding protein [unclassified Bartonella]|uniref:ATP-binding protein n=1 Tax=unclassified Bartonella TaxID=2645622 RepID=UPI0035D0783B